jgi:peroxiredoxin
MLSRSNWLILAVAVAASATGGYVQHRSQQPVTDTALIGQPAPDISLPGLDGKTHRLSDYLGRRVVLNFWATDCEPCLAEMPTLDRARQNFGEKGAIVLGIAMDDPSRVRAFLATHAVGYPIWFGQFTPPSSSLQLGDTSEVLPYSVLIDANGEIESIHVGSLPNAVLKAWLAPVPAHS